LRAKTNKRRSKYLDFTSNVQEIPYLAVYKYKKTDIISINVTSRRVRVTTPAVEKQYLSVRL
jgi:hypothetical protein